MKISSLFENKLVKGVFVVATGTAGAQLITILCSPIITRLYGPELFGLLGSFTALATILLPLMTFSYSMAVILPKKESTAIQLAILSLVFALGWSLVIFIVLYSSNDILLGYFSLSELDAIEIIISVYVLLLAALEVFTYLALRKKYFSLNSKVLLFQSLLSNGLKLGLGSTLDSPITLIAITTFVTAVSVIIYFCAFRRSITEAPIKVSHTHYYRALAYKFKDFFKYRTPQRLLAGLNQSLPIILLASLFGAPAAGFFTLCRSILTMPLNLIAKSVSDVLYPNISERFVSGIPIFGLLLKSTLVLALIGVIPMIILILFSPWLFSAVFGSEWHQAGVYAQWFSVWLFFNFINRPCVAAVAVLKFEKVLLVNSIFNTGLVLSAFYLGGALGSDVAAVALFSIAGIIPQLIIIGGVLLKAKRHSQYKSC
ncbi:MULTISPECIES: oligosaccharide flippase family protein [Pseudoalteromonas]|uniref:oligosaccharide flippase family protein n=1 Tax=Pseudoalteromonas TaxID=53246 RepID=UPI001C94FA90|nr:MULTISPECIES: oligosaccharide flippase family protein [Pseudoalteromonas]MCG7538922.1 oligosaccharide flippase family protein [Pseudoalteromonas sp. OF7H-1]MCG9767313.1 oligosaccharide flippase family protein [Pseudoalteromonas piscicida]QZO13460.1 oligosaccharide flippase family protein [Pseudoalteromonas piscicida]